MRCTILMALVMCSSLASARAETVSADIQLPPTVEPGRGTPACGNPGARTTADNAVSALGGAIDSALSGFTGGLPLATGVFSIPGVNGWIKSRLGMNDGPSACGTVCVSYSGTSEGSWVVKASDNTGSASLNTVGPEFGIGWAKIDRVTHASTGTNSVSCANVRHWKHDRYRNFKLTVNF